MNTKNKTNKGTETIWPKEDWQWANPSELETWAVVNSAPAPKATPAETPAHIVTHTLS